MEDRIRKPSLDMTGKSVLITGGTKGIGFATAASFAMCGAYVSITSRHGEECAAAAEKIQSEYGGRCIGVRADSSVSGDVDALIEAVVGEYGKIDVFVNNAGVGGKTALILSQTEENFDYVVNTNLKGVYICAQKVAAQMVKQGHGGKIINVASSTGLTGTKGISIYAAAKAGVVNLTKTMALEWARYGITVNAVCPYYIVTDLNRDVISEPTLKERLIKDIPLRRFGETEEIAGPILAMASDSFSFMNGTSLLLDGGFLAGK